MANPQAEDGHIRIANTIVKALVNSDLKGPEFRVLLAIIRKTWGWKKKREVITIGQMEKITSLNRRAVIRATQSLLERKIIRRFWHLPKGSTQRLSSWEFNKNFDQWEILKVVTTMTLASDKNDTTSKKKSSDKNDTESGDKNDTPLKATIKQKNKRRRRGTGVKNDTPPSKKENERKEIRESGKILIEKWNKQKLLTKHKSKKIIKAILDAVVLRIEDGFTVADLALAIGRYGKVMEHAYKGELWCHRWSMQELLTRKDGKWVQALIDDQWLDHFQMFKTMEDMTAPDIGSQAHWDRHHGN
jgi:phage replication O-like protein O